MRSLLLSTQKLSPGVTCVLLVTGAATWAATLPWALQLRLSPLIIGILLGALIGNLGAQRLPATLDDGVVFCAKKLLKLGIILYGFRISFVQVAQVGPMGLALDAFIVASTLLLGTYLGTRWLGLDRATAVLTAAGSAICGAAAVVATEPVVRGKPHQTATAVATVVLFGTLAMVLYPLLFRTGWLPLSEHEFGVYIGASLHGVAHAVAASDAVGSEAADVAIIVKMTRVLMLAPALLIIGYWVRKKGSPEDGAAAITTPWFAIIFLGVAGFNTLDLLPAAWVAQLVALDKWILTMAMTALGMGTVFGKVKGLGPRPFMLALVLFAWLVGAGLFGTSLLF